MPTSTPLLERDEELAAIERVLASAVAGDGSLATIEGEAGAGKTALLDAAGRQGEKLAMRVLRARGGEYERDFPYGVVRQLFESLLGDETLREELLSGSAASAAPVFEPEVAPTEGADPFAVQHGLHRLVDALAGPAPLLMLVDDAQWADLASLRALAYVGRRLAALPAAMVLTVRTGEPGEHERLLDELRCEPGARTIEPRPLSASAAAELVLSEAGRRPSGEFAAACCDAAAGNPFLLVELLHGLDLERMDDAESDAERLAEVAAAGASRTILARLAQLGGGSKAVARAVAVLEPNAEARLVAALSGLPAERVTDECERLVVAHLLSDSHPVAFVHPLVREAVLGEVPAPRRAAEHARAARLLAEDGAAADTVAAQLLLAEAGGDERVVEELRAAATGALGRGAPEAAVSYLRRALREPPPKGGRLAVSRELGVALLRADEPEGIEVLRAVRSALHDPVARAEVATELSASLAVRRPGAESAALVEESLAEIPDHSTGIGLLLRGFLLMHLLTGLEQIPAGLLPDRDERPDGGTLAGRLILREMAFLHALGLGPIDRVLDLAEGEATDPDLYEADALAGLPAPYALGALTLADCGDRIAEPFTVAIEASKRRGTAPGVSAGHGMRAYCRLADGDLDGATEDVEAALRLIRPTGLRPQLAVCLAAALKTLIARGDPASAQELLDDVWHGRDPGPGLSGAVLLIARGELRHASGRHAEARHDFLAAAERIRWLPYANPEVLGWRTGLALAAAALGNDEEGRQLAREAVRLAREAGGARGVGVALRVLGAVSDGPEGIDLLREAAGTLAPTRARLQHAQALADLGAALRRAGLAAALAEDR
jgi:tetratricopeptide (TPR) repeat protein